MTIDRTNNYQLSQNKKEFILDDNLGATDDLMLDLVSEPIFLSDLSQNNDDYLVHDWDESYVSILHWCTDVIAKSPTGRLFLEEAAQEDWRVGVSADVTDQFHIDVAQGVFYLGHNDLDPVSISRSAYFCNAMLVGFIRALREIWQEKRYGGFDETYIPEDVLMLERVRSADNDVMTTLVAWELREVNYPEVWRHLVGSPDGDITMAFSSVLEQNPTGQFDRKALVAAFCQWYENEERVNACDHKTLEYLDEVIEESGSYCFGSTKLTPIGVEVLSCLPDRTAYLRGFGHDILTDPGFAGLHSEINQSHFFHIMYDTKVTHAGGVPFQDASLAAKLFPDG